jgi:hypothetical protein
MASAIGPAVVANSRGRGGQRESVGVVRAQGAQRPSHGPADCRCGGEGAARPFPHTTKIVAGKAGGLLRATPARASDRHPTGPRRRSAAWSERSGDRARSPRGRAQAALSNWVKPAALDLDDQGNQSREEGRGPSPPQPRSPCSASPARGSAPPRRSSKGEGLTRPWPQARGLTIIGRDDPPNHGRRKHQSDMCGVEDMSACGHGAGREPGQRRRYECARSRHCGNDSANALNARSA